jgi:uncharacterized protein (TIGR03083 family)
MTSPTADEFRTSIAADAERIAALADAYGSSPVPSCPGWDVTRLAGHVGRVHRMALSVLTSSVDGFPDPGRLEKPPTESSLVGDYVRGGAQSLDVHLAACDPAAPCWNFLNQPALAEFWFRRQCHETAVHRFDAELAVDAATRPTTPPTLAVDGIDEYFVLVGERLLAARGTTTLGGTLHLHATDTSGEWMIDVTDGVVTVSQGHGKGDAAIRGTAADLFLGLWGRFDLPNHDRFERFGSAEVIAALATLGGI